MVMDEKEATEELSREGRATRNSWLIVIAAAVITTILVTLLDQWLLGGLLIGGLLIMLVVENIRRTWDIGSSIRFGIALGLLGAWLVWKFF